MRICFLILISFCCSGQSLKWLRSPSLYDPTFIYTSPINGSQVNLVWGNNGADSYTLERATNAGFTTSLTTLYSGGTNTSYNDTGVSSGTTYYYRVKTIKAGYANGIVSTSASPISFNPIAWYEPSALDYPATTNNYGTTINSSGAKVSSLKSIINTGGPLLSYNSVPFAFNIIGGEFYSPLVFMRKPGQTSGYYYTSASSIVLSGDFTIAAFIRTNDAVSGGTLCETSDQSSYFNIKNTTIESHFNGTTYTLSHAALGSSDFNKIVIRRTGSTLGISSDGGNTFSTTTCATTSITLDNFFGGVANASLLIDAIRLVFVGSSLSSAQCAEIFNYGVASNYTPASRPSISSPLDVSNISFSAFSGPYFNPETLNLICNPSPTFPGQFNIGDKTFLMSYSVNNGTNPNDGKFYIYDHGTGNISSVKTVAGLRSNPEQHEEPAFYIYDNRVNVMQYDQHYDQTQKNFVIRSFGSNFDFNGYVTLPQFGGIPTYSQILGQYPQSVQIGNSLVRINQGFTAAGYSPWAYLFVSNDGGISWPTRLTPVDVSATSTSGSHDWVYPQLVYNEGNDLILGIGHTTVGAAGQYYGAFAIKANASDGYHTWSNISGTFTKDVYTNGGLSISELYTNCLIKDARGTSNSAYMNTIHLTQSDILYGVVANGLGTGWQLYTQTLGVNDAALHDIDFNTHTPVVEPTISGTYANATGNRGSALVVKTSSGYSAYALDKNSGNWKIFHVNSTDGGSTWTDGGFDSTDNTLQHCNMMVDFNYDWCNNALLTASTCLSSTTGKIFIKKIK